MKLTAVLFAAFTMYAAGPGGPVPGWTLDSRTATLRAVTGIPGALRLADPLVLPFGVAAAEFAASGDAAYAIGFGKPAHLMALTALRSTPAVHDLGEVPEGTRILALNPKGAALIYTPSTQQIRLQNLTESITVSAANLAGPITAGLLESDGRCAVLATASLERLCSDGAQSLVLADAGLSITALAFGGTEQEIWVASLKQVLRVSNGVASVMASDQDGLSRPVAIALTPSGQALVADSDAQALFLIDAAGTRSMALDIVPSQLKPLADPSLFLLNDLSSLPFTLFSAEGMRTYFVPAN